MKKVVLAEVKWIPRRQGGRPVPQIGGKYCPIIRFDDIYDIGCDWSAEILCTEYDCDLNSIVELSYLVEWAPFENLKLGNRFKLFEGDKLVAEGIIVLER